MEEYVLVNAVAWFVRAVLRLVIGNEMVFRSLLGSISPTPHVEYVKVSFQGCIS